MDKICSICGEKKSENDFYKSGSRLRTECKLCHSINYKKTKKGLIIGIYGSQKLSSKQRGYDPPSYSKDDLIEWAYSQTIFHELYSEWVANGYNKDLTPSFDRKDDYKPYTLSNLQIMTWGENRMKGHLDMVNGINNKQNHAVRGIHIESGEIKEFYSIHNAGRNTSADYRNIWKCLKGERKSTGGYEWELIKN